MKKAFIRYFIVFLFIYSAAFRCRGTTVTLSSSPVGRSLADSSGQVMPDGNLVQIGSFPDGFDFGAVASIDDVTSGLILFHNAATDSAFDTYPGKLLGTYTVADFNAARVFNNRPIYVVVFNGPNTGTATEAIIFTSSDDSYIFPEHVIGIETATVSINVEPIDVKLGSLDGNLLKTAPLQASPALAYFPHSTGVGGSLLWVNGLGWVDVSFFPWAYHYSHGWLYCAGPGGDAWWFYDMPIGWIWISEAFYPWIYQSGYGWLYFATGSVFPEQWFMDYQLIPGDWIKIEG